ncbi:hypothetical protein G6539_20810, partial [Streptomyces albidoflavus]|nr:hypothetical protein [Streptomyces albidoflavus]
VREHLRGRVPAHLVPGRLAVLERMPLTVSGKIDRRAAEAAVTALTGEADRAVPGQAPATPLEALVAAARDLLQAPAFGPDDDFLAHGGDSLTALRLCAALRTRGLALRPAQREAPADWGPHRPYEDPHQPPPPSRSRNPRP